MTSTITDRLYGENSNLAIKAPVVAVTNAPTSGPLYGLQNVNGYQTTGAANERVLVMNEANPVNNGIYNPSTTNWQRTGDFDGAYDITQGTLIVVCAPNAITMLYQLVTANPVIIGSTPLTFTQFFPLINPYPISQAEINAGVTPTNYYYIWGDARRYGAVLDGATDDTVALQNWAKVGGGLTIPAQTALISAPIVLSSNTSITAPKGATITTATGGISLFSATDKTDIRISGLKFVNTSSTAGFGVVFAHCYFVGCTRPVVVDCEFTGMNCSAITFDGCSDPIAQYNNIYTGNYPANQQQTSDIALFGYTASTVRGVITGNRCYGGGNFGIVMQDAYSFFNPLNNIVSDNRIGGCQLYGILNYMPSYAPLNTFNQITDNYIENIQGVTNIIGGAGGAGIYVVGGASGGTLIEGNTIVNCCINTQTRSLAPAGIGISATNGAIYFTASVGGATSGTLAATAPFATGAWNGASGNYIVNFSDGEQRLVTLTNGATTCTWSGALSAGTILSATLAAYYNDPVSVVGNKISGMTQYDGILVVSSLGSGVVVNGNTINHPPGNTTGYPIHVQNSSLVTVSDNIVQQQSLLACVYVESQTNTNAVIIKGNNCAGGADAASTASIQVTGDGTHGVSALVIADNILAPNSGGAGTAAIWLSTAAASSASITGNSTNVATMPALLVQGCTGIRVSNNYFASTGTNAVTTSGNCTGSFFDKTNLVSGGVVNNGATNFLFDQFGAAAPASGTWGLGDCITNNFASTNTNGQFRCTVAGSPGTWVGHV
jgi:Right handed beta helix region